MFGRSRPSFDGGVLWDIDLTDIKLRYYYSIDGEKPQTFVCDYAFDIPAGSDAVTGKFVKMSLGKTGSDHYLEVGFAEGAGSLRANQDVPIQ